MLQYKIYLPVVWNERTLQPLGLSKVASWAEESVSDSVKHVISHWSTHTNDSNPLHCSMINSGCHHLNTESMSPWWEGQYDYRLTSTWKTSLVSTVYITKRKEGTKALQHSRIPGWVGTSPHLISFFFSFFFFSCERGKKQTKKNQVNKNSSY